MPTLVFVLVTVFWGSSYIFIKIGLAELSPLSFIFFRFLIAAVSLLPLLRYEKAKIKTQDLLRGAQLGGLLGLLMFFQTIALKTLHASSGAFLLGFTPIFVLLIRFLVQRKAPSLLDVGAILVCIAGLKLITHSHGLAWEPGVLYMLLSAFFVALYIYAMEAYASSSSLSVLTFMQMLLLTIFAGLTALAFEGGVQIPTRVDTWVGITACSILCTSLAFGMQAYSQRYLSAFKIAMIAILEPVFATLFAWLFLDDVLDTSFYLGAGLILAAIGVINWRLQKI